MKNAYTVKSFTPEELLEIRNSVWVKSATTKMIRVTAEFKAEFWRQYTEEGKTPRQIIANLGLNANVLGETRIAGIKVHIEREAKIGEFSNVRKVTPFRYAPLLWNGNRF